MNDSNVEVGKRILGLRKSRGYSREKLSELADISVQFIADIESGRKSMTVATVRKLSSALNISADYIINGSEGNSAAEEIKAILDTVPPYQQQQAVRLLEVFAESIRNSNV